VFILSVEKQMFKNFVGVHRHIPHENLEIYIWFKLLYYATPCICNSLVQRSFWRNISKSNT